MNFEILSFRQNKSGGTETSFKPYSIRRLSDGEIFTLGDLVTNGTKMVGKITEFSFLEDSVYVDHTYSGVGMNLDSLIKYTVKELPSEIQLNQVVKASFLKGKGLCTIRGVHFFPDKIKYDLGIWLGDGSVDDPERETRVYNVDSEFISAF